MYSHHFQPAKLQFMLNGYARNTTSPGSTSRSRGKADPVVDEPPKKRRIITTAYDGTITEDEHSGGGLTAAPASK
uniref:Uncharacterized protein n=1 Tax=Romanomermis culicivorax TaxID=13658 RepID=A0A915KI87_ROMCU